LPAGEALAVMEFIAQHQAAQHQAADLADPWARPSPVKRVAVRRLSRVEEAPLHVAEPLVVVVKQPEIYGEALVDGRLGKPLRHTLPVRFGGELRADLGPVILAIRRLKMGQQLRPLVHQVHPAPEQIPRGPPLGGIDIGLGTQAPTAPHRHLMRVDRIVLGVAPVHRLHVERVAQDEGHPFAGAEVGEPGPGEDAFDADDEILPVGGHGFQKWVGGRLPIPVLTDLSLVVQDAERHTSGVEIDATITLVWLGVESPEVSSSFVDG